LKEIKGIAVDGFHYNLGPFFSSKLVVVIFDEVDKLNPPLISHFNNFNALSRITTLLEMIKVRTMLHSLCD